MKSINTKVSIIIICGFLLQLVLIGSIYRLVISRQLLASINAHETARQEILESTVLKIEKGVNNTSQIEDALKELSKKYDVSFQLNDMDGNTLMNVDESKRSVKRLQEMSFIRFKNKPAYVIYAKYPLKLKSLPKNIGGQNYRLYFAIVIISTSLIISLLIYRVFTLPVKKLRKAVDSMNYGNTIVKIPYNSDDEIGDLCRKFEEMGQRLKKSEDNQMEIIQAISHDIKTPLTSIIGYIKRLRDGKAATQEKINEYYEIIHRKSNDVKGLIDELDEYASLNKDNAYEKNAVSASEFCVDIFREFQDEINQGSGKLDFTNKLDTSLFININQAKIKRVLGNIIENAIKYAGDKPEININCEREKNSIRFSICDNGPGVPQDQLEKIFDRFYRLDTSRSREKGGTGLGLAICKGIIEGHGGRIRARNNSDGGLCIEFWLPVLVKGSQGII